MFDEEKTIKNIKVTKRPHGYKDYESTYTVDIFNALNLEPQLKNDKSAIKNKLKDLLTEWRGFKFVAALVIEI